MRSRSTPDDDGHPALTARDDRPPHPGAIGEPGPSWTGGGAPAASAEATRTDELARPSARAGKFVSPSGLPLATFWMRAIGFAMDAILFGLLAVIANAVFGISPALAVTDGQATTVYLFGLLLGVAYNWLWNSIGWSPGKRVLGLRIVDAEGSAPGVELGFRRTVISLVSELALLIGYLWAYWDRQAQTWHDKAAGTYVVSTGPREERDGGPRRPAG